jgi:cyclic beta-1,2-glucan synthetase
VLGLRLCGGHTIELAPCIPDQWPGFTVTWKLPDTGTVYEIQVNNPDACSAAILGATVDGSLLSTAPDLLRIPMARDGRRHQVTVTLGPPHRESDAS